MAISPLIAPYKKVTLPTDPGLNLRILIAEDDPFTLTILKKRLMMGGYNIATATNGREALDLVESFKPNLILSDWMMPEMDGLEFCTRVKEKYNDPPIYFILLTAKDKHEDKVSALDTGADEYLVKPCDGRELMARLRAAERILRLQQELSCSNECLQQAIERIHGELEVTSDMQRRMLPQVLPNAPGYTFTAHYQPSTECSGDFYDILPLDKNRLGIAIGDVSGHGTPAMVTMALTHMLLHLEADKSTDPAYILYNLNNKMCAYLPTEQYVTMFIGVLELSTGLMTYCSAGHNPPLRVDLGAGHHEFLSGCEGFPIKLVGVNMPYENRQFRLEQGQALVLYTDGLLEAFDDENCMFGMDGLVQSATTAASNTPEVILKQIMDDFQRKRQGYALEDDLSVLIVSRA